MTGQTLAWWLSLCSAAAINVAAWTVSAWLLRARKPDVRAGAYDRRKVLLWLAGVYVLGCGFRSVLPMIDVPRLCLHDTWLSRIVVGRAVATVAELAFAAQWALLLHEAGTAAGHRLAMLAARMLVAVIVVAELASWGAVLAANNLSHVIENSLWTLAAALALAGFAAAYPELDPKCRGFLHAAALCGIGYIVFMITVDVPMYLARWQHDLAAGRPTLALIEGAREIVARCSVSRDWAAWREDAVWLSLYFTVAVWISIALVHAPPLAPRPRPALKTL